MNVDIYQEGLNPPNFRIYNHSFPPRATKMARIQIKRCDYVQNHEYNTWILDEEEKQNLVKLLSENNFAGWKSVIGTYNWVTENVRKLPKKLPMPNYLNLRTQPNNDLSPDVDGVLCHEREHIYAKRVVKSSDKYDLTVQIYLDIAPASLKDEIYSYYFRVYNSGDINRATNVARVLFKNSYYLRNDDPNLGWVMNFEERQRLVNLLSDNDYEVWKQLIRTHNKLSGRWGIPLNLKMPDYLRIFLF